MIKTKTKKYRAKNILKEIRKKYGERLKNIDGLQDIQEEILKETNGKIINNSIYHHINERCQKKILELEHLNLDVTKYRKRQDKIETKADVSNRNIHSQDNSLHYRNKPNSPKEYRVDFKSMKFVG